MLPPSLKGRGRGWGLSLPFLHHLLYLLHHSIGISNNFFISESYYYTTIGFQYLGALFIIFLLLLCIMISAINLYDNSQRETDKVDNVITYSKLSSEPYTYRIIL